MTAGPGDPDWPAIRAAALAKFGPDRLAAIIRGVERLTGETYDPDTDTWTPAGRRHHLMNRGRDRDTPPPSRYRHPEAFMIMTYRADDGIEEERIWNSRDGVTPFVITLRNGKQATHVDWGQDQRMAEDWTPPPGMRYFADLTPERARVHAARNYDAWTADPAQPRDIAILGANRERAIAKLAESYLERPGGPDLIDPQAAS